MKVQNFTFSSLGMISGLVIIFILFFFSKSNSQNWGALGSGTNNPVLASATFNGDLYIAGKFTSDFNLYNFNIPTGTYFLLIYTNELPMIKKITKF